MMVQMYRDPILKRLEEPSGGLSETFEIAIKLVGVAGVPAVRGFGVAVPVVCRSIAELAAAFVRGLALKRDTSGVGATLANLENHVVLRLRTR